MVEVYFSGFEKCLMEAQKKRPNGGKEFQSFTSRLKNAAAEKKHAHFK